MKSRRGQAHVRISRPCRSAEQSRLKPKRWSSLLVETIRAAAADRQCASSSTIQPNWRRNVDHGLWAGRPASQPAAQFLIPIEKRCRFASYQRADLSFSSFIYSCTGIRFVSPLLLGLLGLLGSVGSLGPRQPGIRHKNKKTVEMFDESKQRERERHKIIITARQI